MHGSTDTREHRFPKPLMVDVEFIECRRTWLAVVECDTRLLLVFNAFLAILMMGRLC